jgi:hypothetical protein
MPLQVKQYNVYDHLAADVSVIFALVSHSIERLNGKEPRNDKGLYPS